MDELRTALCKNEDRVAIFCRENGIKYSSTTKKNYFQSLTHDGDIYHYILTSMSSPDMKKLTNTLHAADYQTCLDLIEDYFTAIQPDDYLEIESLIMNEKYSTYQIAALAQSYNIVIGMQYVERNGKKYVIIKSTIEDKHNKQGYHDHWIVPEKSICYYMQKENPANVERYTFSYQPNQRIFDSIFDNTMEPLPIYLFTRSIGGIPYTFKGKYRSIGLTEKGKAFILGNTAISEKDPAISTPLIEFEHDFQKTTNQAIIGRKSALHCAEPPSLTESQRASRTISDRAYLSERDYIYEARLREKIGDLGEEAVWEYEQAKIRKALSNEPERADILISTMDWVSKKPSGEKYGYDIRSYNIVNGEAIPIFIEVKTTTGDSTNGFYITEHELETARSEEINRNYYIYRVYNINGSQPMFYFMKGDPVNFYKLKPFIWLAKIK
jgi:hypothetical protein